MRVFVFFPLLFCKNLKLLYNEILLKKWFVKGKAEILQFFGDARLDFFLYETLRRYNCLKKERCQTLPMKSWLMICFLWVTSTIGFSFFFLLFYLFLFQIFFLVFYCILIMYSSILICFEFHRKPLELIIHPRISASYILLQCFGELPVFQNRGSSANANCLTVGLSILKLRKITGLLFVLQEHLSYYYIKEHRKQTALSDHSPLP